MIVRLAILYAVTALLVVGCSSPYAEELTEINDWRTEIEEAQGTFEAIDSASVFGAMADYARNLETIKTRHSGDSVDQDFARLMNTYKGIRGVTKHFKQDYKAIKREFLYTNQQLADLSDDMTNGDFDNREDALAAFNSEKIHVMALVKSVQALEMNATQAIGVHDSTNHLVEDYVEKL